MESGEAAEGEDDASGRGAELDGSILQSVQNMQGATTVAEIQKLRERLVTQFHARMGSYREMVYRVLGWKVWMEEQGNVGAFQSQYAAAPGDVVRCRITRGSDSGAGDAGIIDVQLLETKFVRELDDDVLAIVHRFGSLPAFMANLLGS